MKKLICGKGDIGKGKYKSRQDGKITIQYSKWYAMIKRCYSPYTWKKRKNYKDCEVCEEWLNFQTFAKWYDDNVTDISFHLDKDILIQGNKLYSPDTCCLVPQAINSLFEGELTGVSRLSNGRYRAYYSEGNKQIHLGCYTFKYMAFNVYADNKELWIKKVANKYKNVITNQVYNSLMNYEIERMGQFE